MVKSQVPKFHQKMGKKFGIIWLFIQLITVSFSTLGDLLEVTYVWVKSIS